MNYKGPARIVVTLVTDNVVPKIHAHELVGKNCQNGICVVELKGNEPRAESVVSFIINSQGYEYMCDEELF